MRSCTCEASKLRHGPRFFCPPTAGSGAAGVSKRMRMSSWKIPRPADDVRIPFCVVKNAGFHAGRNRHESRPAARLHVKEDPPHGDARRRAERGDTGDHRVGRPWISQRTGTLFCHPPYAGLSKGRLPCHDLRCHMIHSNISFSSRMLGPHSDVHLTGKLGEYCNALWAITYTETQRRTRWFAMDFYIVQEMNPI